MTGTFREAEQGLRFAVEGIEVAVVAGPNEGRRARAPRGDCLRIGREPGNDLTLDDRSVSQHHCELRSTAAGWVLSDRSTNGTRIKGVRVREALIEDETLVDVGNSRVRVAPIVDTRAADDIPRPPDILGGSALMLRVFDRLQRVAKTDLSVLLTGETGTGKELAARELHRLRAARGRAGPFVVVDCTNVPSTLAESMFLGHKKGSFTGAVEDRRSPFEAAASGTVFLDEIGELPYELQSKLLRIVQTREVQAVGSNVATPIDVRLICATHRDLDQMRECGEFREDLYYRLCESEIRLPPLRERDEDILPLACAFLSECDPGMRFDESTEQIIMNYGWPGNVRQLRMIVRRAASLYPERRVLGATELFDASQPRSSAAPGSSTWLAELFDAPWEQAREGFARGYWKHLHRRFEGSISSMANHADVSRTAVRNRNNQFDLDLDRDRDRD